MRHPWRPRQAAFLDPDVPGGCLTVNEWGLHFCFTPYISCNGPTVMSGAVAPAAVSNRAPKGSDEPLDRQDSLTPNRGGTHAIVPNPSLA